MLTITFMLATQIVAHAKKPTRPIQNAETTILNDILRAANQRLTIAEEKNRIIEERLQGLRIKKQQQLLESESTSVKRGWIERVEFDQIIARSDLDEVNLVLADAQQTLDTTKQLINDLRERLQQVSLTPESLGPTSQTIGSLRETLDLQQELLTLEQSRISILQNTQKTAEEIIIELEDWHQQLKNKLETFNVQNRDQQHQKEIFELHRLQESWLQKTSELTSQLKQLLADPDANTEKLWQLEIELLRAEENSNLTYLERVLSEVNYQLNRISEMVYPNIAQLDIATRNINNLSNALQNIALFLQRKFEFVELRRRIAEQNKNRQLISANNYKKDHVALQELLIEYKRQQTELEGTQQKLLEIDKKIKLNIKEKLAERQGLSGFRTEMWPNLGSELLRMPVLAAKSLVAIKEQFAVVFQHAPTWRWWLMGATMMLLLVPWLLLRPLLTLALTYIEQAKQVLSANAAFILLKLIERNLRTILIFGVIGLSLYISSIPFLSYSVFIWLGVVWVAFKLMIDLARLTLLETEGDHTGRDVKLYKGLKWSFLLGGIVTALTVLSHQLPVDYEVRDFFFRFFALFLFVVGITLLKNWEVIPVLVHSYFAQNRWRYLQKIIRLFSFTAALSVLTIAMLGFFGYIDYARSVSRYVGLFLLVLTGYLLSRDIFIAAMESLSKFFIQHVPNGWLWTQAILEPLDRILRLALFLSAVVILFFVYGWDGNSVIITLAKLLLFFPLAQVAGVTFTPFTLIQLIILAYVLFWLGRWTREFSYRWLFAKTTDLGIRNSLSVFCQYAAVGIGIVVGVRVVGLELSGLGFVMGGLAVGVGFGLRDLANNFVSGILLLIERPVRKGDFVTIGGFEGEVTHIGMRSMIVKTADHMEVLIPNSETFSKSFTNWTHQDSIVRSVVPIKIHRHDDPHFVQKITLQALTEISDIVSDPEPRVYLKDISESLVELEIRYFVNLQQNSSRAGVRSKVLLHVWDQYKQHGIKPPYPQQDIYVQSLPEKN